MAGLDPQALEGYSVSDRIRLGRLRAVGWVGYLFQGEILALGRPVASCAVKLMHPRPMCAPETLIQDLREQGRYVHPHLLALQHSGLIREGPAQGWVYLAWELADYSIQDLLTRGQTLTPTQVRECLVHILEALRYLHSQGVYHGDIRPANILSTTTGWRLSGLEYRGALSRRVEELGYSQNHFVFRAPETQERGVDHGSADIWSLAVVAHAALTGHLPFDEEDSRDRTDLLWRIVNQDPLVEELGEPFDRLMRNCLVREARLRWSAEQALACLQGKPVADNTLDRSYPAGFEPTGPAEPMGPVVMAAPPPPPASSPVYIGLGVSLVIVGLFIGKFLLPPPAKRVTQVLPEQLVNQRYTIGYLDDRGRLRSESGQAPVLREDLGVGQSLELVQVPAGDFDQGTPDSEPQRELDEGPRRRVRLDTFYMSRFEISQKQWTLACSWPVVELELPRAPWRTSGADLPVHGVSWDQAREFCLRLSQALGRNHRLPTEAEWEYACRGGPVDTPFHFGNVITSEVANFSGSPVYNQSVPSGSERGGLVEVNTFPYANHFGLYQMHGNVKEWCSDLYAPYTAASQKNPIGAESGQERVVRGGGYRSPAYLCRSGARSHDAPHQAPVDVGFRVVVPEVASVRGR